MVDPGAGTWNDLFLAHWTDEPRPALIGGDEVWSGAELVERAAGAALLLAGLVERGQSVPGLVDESPTAIALAAGGSLAARPLAPLGTRLPAADLAAIVRGLEASVLVTSSGHRALADEVARLSGARVEVIDEVGRSRDGVDDATPDDPFAVLHTSGTTGAPRAVVARQRAIVARVGVYQQVMPLEAGDRFCSFSGFQHTTGITAATHALATGASVLPMPWFSIDGWRQAGELDVTHALLVPTMLDLLLAAGALPAAQPRVVQYGAAPIGVSVLRDAMVALPAADFLQIFGQTELSPITALLPDDHRRAVAGDAGRLSTVGRAVPGATLRLGAPDGDGIGELAVHAPHAFEAGTDGWRATGDLATIDDDGYVSLVGRVADRIDWAGENVYPAEVEAVIASHRGVREVAVVGVPDRRYGEVIRAVIVPVDPNSVPSEEDLAAHAALRLATFKVPAEWVVVDELPRNAAGKVVRRRLV